MLLSCSSNDDNIDSNLIGTWKLAEVNNDPGDGSGTFHKVNTNKTLLFKGNKIVKSNGSLCENTITSDSSTSGTFELDENSSTSGRIKSGECNIDLLDAGIPVRFEIEKSILYVYYPCIEGCAAKYIKQK